ncbi:MAG: hypothetical protein J5662_09655 [Clostridia bacterium]|nr:hypothetical protein [Clostridia bacterium]
MIFTLKKFTLTDYAKLISAILLIGVIIYKPSVCAVGAKYGLYISATILIPSLFPFAVPVLYILNTGLISRSKRPLLPVFLLSLTGGYPIGAKLLSELKSKKGLPSYNFKRYLPFCVGGGPAFIIIAVGKRILKSAALGYILFASHLLSSILIMLIFARGIMNDRKVTLSGKTNITENNFAESIKNASETSLYISAFVVFFSVINQYLSFYSAKFPIIKYFLYISEVSSAVMRTKNIYLISFLLGFAGISIWIQIFSLAGSDKPRIFIFALIRTLHGILSALITAILIKLFKITVITLGNAQTISKRAFFNNITLSLSLLVMLLLLLINITAKKHSGNLLKDVL